MNYVMTTKDGTRYELDDKGAVLSRSDGPKDWDYSGRWIILGFKKRHHSYYTIPLSDAADGADVGHGVVMDLDHGTRRQWAHPRGRQLQSIRRS